MKLFDLDGTLIDSNGVWQEVDERFLSARCLTATKEYLDFVGHAIFPTAAQFTIDYYRLSESPQEIMDEWMALAKDAYMHHIPLKPGAKEFLQQERANGETLALVTACVPELASAILDRHGLTPLFHHLVYAQELGLEKRDPRFFDRVLEHLCVSATECTFYDDAPDNCAAAKKTGMQVVGILDSLFKTEAGRMARLCDNCIYDFTGLIGRPFPPQARL